MSKRYDYIKSWRKAIKERAVRLMGGKCVCCGYDICLRAMDFHHVESGKKDFTIAQKIMSWDRIVDELKKCILVCCRCHREIHSGIRIVPLDVPGLDLEKVNFKDQVCPICNKEYMGLKGACSQECTNVLISRSMMKISKIPDKEILQELIDEKMQWKKIAEMYGVTPNTPKKWAVKYGIPFERRKSPWGQCMSKDERNKRAREKRVLKKREYGASS